eukprot:782718_1
MAGRLSESLCLRELRGISTLLKYQQFASLFLYHWPSSLQSLRCSCATQMAHSNAPLLSRVIQSLSIRVQTKLDEFDNYRKTYFVIAMHIRTGGFFDDQRHSKEEINWFWDCARNISKFRPSGRKYAWFVTSDHPQMIQTAKTEGEALSIPVFNTKEIYMHTERSRENSTEENWIKTATDWFLLGKSDLFLASKSAFSLSAKYYGLPGYKLIGDRC